jgi:hypothetical protein
MTKKIHPADAATIVAIERASYFTVTMLVDGHHERIEFKSLDLARAARPQFEQKFGGNRRALIYAVTSDDFSHMVPDWYQPVEKTMTATQTATKKIPVPPPRSNSSVLSVELPKLAVGTMIDGVDCGDMTDDPKKPGVPVYLQTQNKRDLSPENKAKIDELKKKLAAEARAKTIERKQMAKNLGMSPAQLKTTGAKLKSEKKEATKKAKAPKVKKPKKERVDISGRLLQALKRKDGVTNGDLVDIFGKRIHVRVMEKTAKDAGCKFKLVEKEGELKRYVAIAA